mmetsp:Transcript_9551/g.23808  ORF Transcript_9551/g.23808 Transcript_9551/m.23808 type:complete len:287 (-) Transcript_9551:36-896(-)
MDHLAALLQCCACSAKRPPGRLRLAHEPLLQTIAPLHAQPRCPNFFPVPLLIQIVPELQFLLLWQKHNWLCKQKVLPPLPPPAQPKQPPCSPCALVLRPKHRERYPASVPGASEAPVDHPHLEAQAGSPALHEANPQSASAALQPGRPQIPQVRAQCGRNQRCGRSSSPPRLARHERHAAEVACEHQARHRPAPAAAPICSSSGPRSLGQDLAPSWRGWPGPPSATCGRKWCPRRSMLLSHPVSPRKLLAAPVSPHKLPAAPVSPPRVRPPSAAPSWGPQPPLTLP